MSGADKGGREEKPPVLPSGPRAERQGEHGLFGSEDAVSLDAALKELEEHQGNVWTFIYSLRREDAQRLGYDRAAAWRTLLRSQQVEMATAMKLSPDKLRWYAAFHDEDTHPHIHMMVWSADSKQGYLTRTGVAELRSKMTGEVFRDELLQLYRQKDMSYKEVTEAARDALQVLRQKMTAGFCGHLLQKGRIEGRSERFIRFTDITHSKALRVSFVLDEDGDFHRVGWELR